MEKLFYSRQETADLLNISTDTLDKLANSGKLKKTKIGARTVYGSDQIVQFAQRLVRKGAIYYA